VSGSRRHPRPPDRERERKVRKTSSQKKTYILEKTDKSRPPAILKKSGGENSAKIDGAAHDTKRGGNPRESLSKKAEVTP